MTDRGRACHIAVSRRMEAVECAMSHDIVTQGSNYLGLGLDLARFVIFQEGLCAGIDIYFPGVTINNCDVCSITSFQACSR